MENERLKPDLIVKNKMEILVLDVTVRYESKDYLIGAARKKIEKYDAVSQKLKRDFNVRRTKIVPMVGSRRALPLITTKELAMLGISKSDWLTISLIALRSTIEMVNAFMDE